jgi:hypothetical protein
MLFAETRFRKKRFEVHRPFVTSVNISGPWEEFQSSRLFARAPNAEFRGTPLTLSLVQESPGALPPRTLHEKSTFRLRRNAIASSLPRHSFASPSCAHVKQSPRAVCCVRCVSTHPRFRSHHRSRVGFRCKERYLPLGNAERHRSGLFPKRLQPPIGPVRRVAIA